MRFEDYVMGCLELLQERPELKDAPVITAADDEGNDYWEVYGLPTPGSWLSKYREFYTDDDIESDPDLWEEAKNDPETQVAVCLN